MTSNEYDVLKRKINKLEDYVRDIRQDIKDIKMTLDRSGNNDHKPTNNFITYEKQIDILSNSLRSEIDHLKSLPHDEAQKNATENLQKYGLIDGDGNMKLIDNDSK